MPAGSAGGLRAPSNGKNRCIEDTDMKLVGKKILVTGSTMGIGYGAATQLLEEGAVVAIHGRDMTRVRDTIQKLGGGERLVPVIGDVADLDSCKSIVEQAVAQMGCLDCLVNNAGIGELGYLEDLSEEHFDRVINTNLRSAFFLTQYALPELKKTRGNVIFTASTAGICAGPTDSHVYAAAKSGMISLGQSLALELAPYGVRVNMLCPGYIDTPLIAAENAKLNGQVFQFIEACVPLERLGSIEECGSTIAYLASDAAAYFTGSVISNDGGSTAARSWGGRN
jgi:NAD(P)-dependent dehydrogenase (short-subunit alcohol dehydrogenase family)